MTGRAQASDTRIELGLALLKKRALDCGFVVSADDRISERDASSLLELHRDTLARLRLEGKGPPAYNLGLGRARVTYRLLDLSLWVEGRREKFDNADLTRSKLV